MNLSSCEGGSETVKKTSALLLNCPLVIQLCSSMTAERLTGLSLLSIHRDIKIDIDVAIDKFSRRCPRWLTNNN